MGESARLQGTLAGQFGLNDFLGQLNNRVTPQKMIRTILPVQEMAHFQRRYFFTFGTQVVPVGQRISQLRFIVPEKEWWRPLAMQYEMGDVVDHEVEISITVHETATVSIFRLIRTNVFRQERKLIYGALQDGSLGSASNLNYNAVSPIVLEPRDVFVFTDLTNVNNAGGMNARWTFVYELVPAPSTQRTAGVDGLVTVT